MAGDLALESIRRSEANNRFSRHIRFQERGPCASGLKDRQRSPKQGSGLSFFLADRCLFSQLIWYLAADMRSGSGESSEPLEQQDRSLQIALLDSSSQIVRRPDLNRYQASAGGITELPLARCHGRDKPPVLTMPAMHRLA